MGNNFFCILKRLFNYKKDFGCLRVMTWELLKYTWNFDRDKRTKIEELKKTNTRKRSF
jgi:hypothetical protein